MTADLERLTRWELSGGTWRVTGRAEGSVTLALETCSGGDVMDTLASGEADVLAYIGDSAASDLRL